MQNPNVVASTRFGPMIVNVNDRFIGAEILHSGYWGLGEVQLIAGLIGKRTGGTRRATFYDIGANIGTHTLGVSRLLGRKVTVRAFEAQRNIYYMLCGNIALNNLRSVYCHHLAVSDRPGEMIRFRTPDYNAPNNLGGLELMPPVTSDNQGMVHGGEEAVSTVTIDAFGEAVDFLKIDIEGMEDRALRGAERTIAEHRPMVFLEIAKTDRDFVTGFFKSRNYAGFATSQDAVFLPREMDVAPDGMQKLF